MGKFIVSDNLQLNIWKGFFLFTISFIILFALAFFGKAYISEDIASCYDFEGDLLDFQGNNNLSAIGSPTYETGISGQGAYFDKLNYARKTGTIQNITGGSNPFTISCFVNMSGMATGDIFGNEAIYFLYGNTEAEGEQIRGGNCDIETMCYNAYSSVSQSILTLTNFTIGEFTYFTTIYDSGTIDFYKDSIYQGSISRSLSITPNILQFAYAYSYSMNGTYDSCIIYDRAISSGEVSELYNSGNGLSCSEIINPPIPTISGNISILTITNQSISLNISCFGNCTYGEIFRNGNLIYNASLFPLEITDSGLTPLMNYSYVLNLFYDNTLNVSYSASATTLQNAIVIYDVATEFNSLNATISQTNKTLNTFWFFGLILFAIAFPLIMGTKTKDNEIIDNARAISLIILAISIGLLYTDLFVFSTGVRLFLSLLIMANFLGYSLALSE